MLCLLILKGQVEAGHPEENLFMWLLRAATEARKRVTGSPWFGTICLATIHGNEGAEKVGLITGP